MSVKTRLRQPIVVVLGHVDHGKTSLLDKIRKTAIAAKEAGGITQHIGASLVPADVIEKIAEPLKHVIPFKLTIPGLLFIDTPGHELFSNLRRRGGSVADIAILVIDIIEGPKPQTYEALDLLLSRKTPFVIALNKIDRIPGWVTYPDRPFIESYQKQSEQVKRVFEERVYDIVGKLYEKGVPSDLFTRIKDFTKKIAIAPVSARTGEGIPELLALLAGLTQTYMRGRLAVTDGPAKGVILEVKEVPGLGHVADVVIYDGILRVGDRIVVGGLSKPIVTTVRTLLMPRPLHEIRSREAKFEPVEEVSAAAGVRVAADGLEEAIAGSPIIAIWEDSHLDEALREVEREVSTVRLRTENIGVVVKADTLGSLEALIEALRRMNIPVRIADIGPVTKSDVIDASVTAKMNKYLGVILAFNVKSLPEAEAEAESLGVRIFRGNIIYQLLEDFQRWISEEKKTERLRALASLVRPGKMRILPGCIFRRSDPAIVGVEILSGVVKPDAPVMDSQGRQLGRIMAIKDRDKSLTEVRAGARVAVSIQGKILVGRHVDEGDIIYTDVPLEHANKLVSEFSDLLSLDELMTLKEIAEIKIKSGEKTYTLVELKVKNLLKKET